MLKPRTIPARFHVECEARGVGREAELHALELAVEQDGSEPVGHVVEGEELEIELVELEIVRVLCVDLVDGVEELQEDGREACLVVDGVVVAACETVA